jgi:hypothetical protein
MPRKKLDNVRVHLLLPRMRYNTMVKLSEKSGYSISELMRRALDEYLSKGKTNGES